MLTIYYCIDQFVLQLILSTYRRTLPHLVFGLILSIYASIREMQGHDVQDFDGCLLAYISATERDMETQSGPRENTIQVLTYGFHFGHAP